MTAAGRFPECSLAPRSPGAIYICTEDVFPSKRLQQLIAQQQRLRTDVPGEVVQKIRFGDHIFIEHAADVVSVLLVGPHATRQSPVPATLWWTCAHIQINVIRPLKFRLKWASWTLPARSVGKGGHPAWMSPSSPGKGQNWGEYILATWPL